MTTSTKRRSWIRTKMTTSDKLYLQSGQFTSTSTKRRSWIRKLESWFKTDPFGQEVLGRYITEELSDGSGYVIVDYKKARWRLEPIAAWYDMWVGLYVDRKEKAIYVMVLPCLGCKFYWG